MITMELVGIKGSRSGLLVSIRDDCEFGDGLQALATKIEENPSFFRGSPVSLDLGWRELREEEFHLLMDLLRQYDLNMLGVISSSQATLRLLEARKIKVIIGRLGLAQHQGRHKKPGAVKPEAPPAPPPPTEQPAPVEVAESPAPAPTPAPQPAVPLLGEPAVVLRKTLRSGQRVDFDGNVIVMGDVNAGAHVEATGDIIVMGSLRGTVHAGCKGRLSASVYALTMHAAHVRVGGQSGEPPRNVRGGGACTQARLENNHIVFIALKPA